MRIQTMLRWPLLIVIVVFNLLSAPYNCGEVTSGTDPKGDPIERVAVTLGRSVCPPTESGYGSPGGEATVKLRLGSQEIIDTAHYHQMTGCGSVSLPATLGQPEKADLFIGSDAGWGGADIGVDRSCQQGSVFDDARVAWPRQRTVLWDPNKERTGCGFFVRFQLGNPVSCSGPTTDGYARLAPGATPAWMYHFDWGQLRPEPAKNIILLDKPYLKSPTPDPSQEGNMDTIFLTRTHLFVHSGNGLSDCNGWFTGWNSRGDLLLTRLRPEKFTRPGYTPPSGSASQSPPIDFRVDSHPRDPMVLANRLALEEEFTLYEPMQSTYTPGLGNNVTSPAADRFLARVSLHPLYEPRRASYSMIGAGFGFPLVAGKLHTIHADLCVMDGNTCQPVPEASRGPESGVSSETVPVYAIPVPEPDEDPWIDLSATWWGKLTLEEQGAQTGDATSKEILHPKGFLSSMNESETLEYLRQHVTWTLTQPANRPDLLQTEEPTIEPDPFSRVVPHAKLNVTEPGIYEVELAVNGGEGKQLVVDKARLLSLDLDAHWPGTLAEPGPLVSDAEEDDPLNLFTAVNDDDDNFDNIVDNDMDAVTGSPTVDPEDDELVTVIVRQFAPPVAGVGVLELTGSEGLRIFSADGTQVVSLPFALDLANPDPESPLSNITTHAVTFVVEATAIADDAPLTLRYLHNEEEIVRDEVHLTIVDPEITGGFTRGSIRYTKTRKAAGHWIVVGELTPERPLSVLVPNVLNAFTATAAMQYGCTQDPQELPLTMQDGSLMNARYFQIQAMLYNTLIAPMNLILQLLGRPLLEEYSAEKVVAWLSQESGIAPSDLLAGKYFVTSAFTDPERCQIKFFFDPGKTRFFNSQQLYVDRVDLDIQHGGQNAAEVPDPDEELRGALTTANPTTIDNDAMLKLVLRKPAFADQLKLNEQDRKVRLTVVPDTITLWNTPTKATRLEPVDGQYEFLLTELDKTVWIEAPEISQTEREIQIGLEWLDATDTVRATACWGDLDIDSDNDAAIMHSPEEDALEDDPGQPGKILVVNTGDQDGDGIPNFADGLLTSQFDTRSTPAGGSLTPVVLELLPEGVDWQNARIRFHYDASNPEAMTVDDHGTPGDPTDDTYLLTDTGHLRLWTKDGNLARQTTTDYLAPDVACPLANLPVEDGRFIRLYLEGVKASPTAADLRRIRVDLDLTGSGQFVEDVDAVRVTVVAVTDMTIYRPESADFTEPLEWGEVIFRDEPVRVKVTLSSLIPTLDVFREKIELNVFSDLLETRWKNVPIDMSAELVNLNNTPEIRLTLPWQELWDLGVLPLDPADTVQEFTSVDRMTSPHPEASSWQDGDAFDAGMDGSRRGKARQNETTNYNGYEPELIAPVNVDFLKSAGVQFIQFRAPGQGGYVTSASRQIQNQADYFYYSGHGSRDGSVAGFSPDDARGHWKQDLKTVIFAGCSVLTINDYARQWLQRALTDPNDRPWYMINATLGDKWRQPDPHVAGPQIFLGYQYRAPRDTQGSDDIIRDWLHTKRYATDWIAVNQQRRPLVSPGLNACAIDFKATPYEYRFIWDNDMVGQIRPDPPICESDGQCRIHYDSQTDRWPPLITYSDDKLTVVADADGNMTTTSTPIIITLTGDTWIGANGEDISVSPTNVQIENLPIGLMVHMKRSNDWQIEVTIDGTSEVPLGGNVVSDLEFTFQDSAFVSGKRASSVIGYNRSGLLIMFF